MAAAIWSQKDMRSPSGGEARHRGGTQVGKAPPSPEMTISGLTRGQVFGEDQSAKMIIPRLCRTCGPPLRRAVSFLGSRLLANQLQHSAPDRARSQSEQAPESRPQKPRRCASALARCAFRAVATTHSSRPAGQTHEGLRSYRWGTFGEGTGAETL